MAVSRHVELLGQLRYAGHGRIVREADGAPVSLLDIVTAYNELRQEQQAHNSKAAEPLSPEAELAATVARQKEDA
jgi:hypothetical protein